MPSCIIVDDEESSINIIARYVDLMPDLYLKASFTNAQTALKEIPLVDDLDLLFLDIDMPEFSGLEIANVLKYKTKKIVFITAYINYAFDAFDAFGSAFLLKPVSFKKFSETVHRLTAEELPEISHLPNSNDHIFFKNTEDKARIQRVQYSDIIAFESFHNHIKVFLKNKPPFCTYLTLLDIQDLISARNEFRRFHRAFVISIDHIDYIEGFSIYMLNGLIITVGEIYKKEFKRFIANHLIKTKR